jgi:dephospho-CoA kinase
MTTRVIGLTGGIGTGKSTVARMLAQLGAAILDADAIGKSVVEEDPEVLHELQQEFGQDIVDDDGRLKRQELGHRIFGDLQKVERLNRIVHPHLIARLKQEEEKALRSGAPLVVVDAALIFEADLEDHFNHIVVVTAALPQRLERVRKRDEFTDEQIMQRIQSQIPIEEKEKHADTVLRNDGSVEELEKSVHELFQRLVYERGAE